jgi:large conductance mechanosensitive channel
MKDSQITIEATTPKPLSKKIGHGAQKGVKAVSSVWNDFKDFLNKGNVVDLAVGLVMGTAFTAIVNSLVKDIITPIFSLGLRAVNLDNAFVTMGCTSAFPKCKDFKYATVADAQKNGQITFNYGAFLQTCFNFLVISLCVFLMFKLYAASFKKKKVAAPKRTCDYCLMEIPLKATKCGHCTSTVVPEL